MLRAIFMLVSILMICACTPNPVINIERSTINSVPLISGTQQNEVAHVPLLWSRDFGKTWSHASNGLPEDIQVSFLEHRNGEIILASDNKGIFISSEQRSKWQHISKGLPNQKINALYLSGDDIYVGVYRAGIFKTADLGKNWISLNANLPDFKVQSILKIDKSLLVGTDSGIFIQIKGSKNWNKTSVHNQVLSLYEYDGRLIAGTSLGTLLSEDQGEHWKWIRKEGAVHYTHNIGPRIYELGISGDLVYSDDWGKSWTKVFYQPNSRSAYIYEITQAGTYYLMSNNYGIHRSNDQGQSWQLIYPNESMAFFDLVVIGNEVYGGTRVWDEFRGRE